jgi:uncharacterized membrane protein YhaH (DUF805 family)
LEKGDFNMQSLSPIGWALRPLKRYAEFSGRSSRAEFWWFFLFVMIIYVVLLIIGFMVSGSSPAVSAGPNPLGMYAGMGAFMAVIGIFWLAILLPTIAVTIRRLHDTDRSGWWFGGYFLLYLIYLGVVIGMGNGGGSAPSVGGTGLVLIMSLAILAYAVTLLVFYCLRGTRGPNRFGDDPYGANVEDVFA